MFITIFLALCLHFEGLIAQALDVNGITLAEKVLAIERLLLTPGTIIFPVTPCNLTLNGPPADISGAQTAAQWVRTVFHDFITADVAAGTGGLDASIGFEADRDENLGIVFSSAVPAGHQSFINETILGFNLFSTIYVSTADFIALGLAVSLLSCDPDARMIKLRGGRIDAQAAGPFGVPRPQDPFNQSLAAFAKAGFSQSEMIQSIACGHTIGAVHKRNFPEIVLDDPVTGPDFDGADTFDSSPFVFDNTGVQEYLTAKGKAGGPLVTTKNETFRSDLRIFDSDHNATITAMSSHDAFLDTCFTVFEKMIDTVPKGQALSDPIVPRQWIIKESHLDLSPSGAVQYSGNITTYAKSPALAPLTASYYYETEGGGNTGKPKFTANGTLPNNIVNGVVSNPFGLVTDYSFNDTFNSPAIQSINIQNVNGQDVFKQAINLNIFVLPSQSFTDATTDPAQPRFVIRAALLSTLSPAGTKLAGTFYYPAIQPNSFAPKYTQIKFKLTSFKTQGLYTIFQGILTQPVGTARGGGGRAVEVQLGTTQRSTKADAGSFQSNFFGTCTKIDMTKC